MLDLNTNSTVDLFGQFGAKANKNINAEVINMHTIKPIDEKLVKSAVEKNKPIFTIEEHNSIGGLGTTVSECIAKIGNAPKLTIFGINDSYSGGGDYEYLPQPPAEESDCPTERFRPIWRETC